MNYDYYALLVKDVEKAPNEIRLALTQVLEDIDAALLITDIPKLKKLKGYKGAYYIKIGDYRLGLYKQEDKLFLARLILNEDLTRQLPPDTTAINQANPEIKPAVLNQDRTLIISPETKPEQPTGRKPRVRSKPKAS